MVKDTGGGLEEVRRAGRLCGKIALITGAASINGVGYSLARKFLAEGADVAITDLRAADVAARAMELAAAFPARRVWSGLLDVTDAAAWDATVDAVVSELGRLDVLVNNAGLSLLGPIGDTGLDTWDLLQSVNSTGVFLGCRAAIRHFTAQGDGGSIVNISSGAGIVGVANGAAYSASKGAVRMLTKALAVEVGPLGVRVNSVHPGLIATDMLTGAAASGAGDAVFEVPIPLGRLGTPDDVSNAVLYLASDESRYVTAEELRVDGGFLAV